MRILTWNINGIRTIPQYHPWNTLKTQEAILDHLNADIICFQEMKSSRKGLTKDIAVPPSYDAFFSFPVKKSGYSGVAIYTRVVPAKAEEGITGLLDLKPPLTDAERMSSSHPYEGELASELDMRNLDSEGRVVVLDFGVFVLINVYCPNDGTEAEDRIQFKIDFQRVMEERVRHLIEVEHREVIVVGDLNACAAIADHCEGPLLVKKLAENANIDEAFWSEKQCRSWLRGWLLEGGGPMIDIVRRQWPDRKDMFTCWNTKISARDSNYGTRIDYILVTSGLLPFVKGADIQPDIKGSDHCPVYVDLDDSIFTAKVETAPRMAAKFWDEYSGKQRVLGDFFGKKGDQPKTKAKVASSSQASQSTASSSSQPTMPSLTPKPSTSSVKPSAVAQPTPSQSKKRKASDSTQPTKKAKQAPGQGKLSTFFGKPTSPPAPITVEDEDDEDYRLALQLSLESSSPTPSQQRSPTQSQPGSSSQTKWKSLLAPIPAPRCVVHDEPAKELTTKQGVNKGKMFFICSRPVGPGYDRGREERRREDVDPKWRCDFFKWSSEVRREAQGGK